LQASQVENWIINTFSNPKYRPQKNTFEGMKDGKLKDVLGALINNDCSQFYQVKRGKKDSSHALLKV
jgi:hypothetical protein